MKILIFYIISLWLCFSALGQEEHQDIYYAKKYIDLNIKSQTKYNDRIDREQKKVLGKLKKKEGKVAKRLKNRDSASYANYKKNPVTFDSISRVKKPDSATLVRKSKYKVNCTIDSLKGVKKFIEDKAHVTGDGPSDTDGYDSKLSVLKADKVYNEDLNNLVNQRTNYLKSLKTKNGSSIPGLKSIQKQTYYSNQKMKVYKQMAEEPSIAEEKALEYLQGKEGFDEYLSYSEGNNIKSMNNMSLDEIEKMGFQTKRKMQANLQKKIGGDLTGLQGNLGGQIKEYQESLKEAEELKKTVKETKASVKSLTKTTKPDFKVNPMRGLPFLKRIEQQYNWQTTRATFDGKPAVFSFAAMAGYKHTPRLSYGLGAATSIGLGTSWNNVRFTFEGIGLRTYAAWQWQYGIGAYAGYERLYKKAVFVTSNESTLPSLTESKHNTEAYSEALLVGLTKAYRINSKMSGSIQLLYDVWWKEKGLRNPIQLRFTTIKN